MHGDAWQEAKRPLRLCEGVGPGSVRWVLKTGAIADGIR